MKHLRNLKIILSILLMLAYLLNSCTSIHAFDEPDEPDTVTIFIDDVCHYDEVDGVCVIDGNPYGISLFNTDLVLDNRTLSFTIGQVNSQLTKVYQVSNFQYGVTYEVIPLKGAAGSTIVSIDIGSELEPEVEQDKTVNVSWNFTVGKSLSDPVLKIGDAFGYLRYNASFSSKRWSLKATETSSVSPNTTPYRFSGKLTNDTGGKANRVTLGLHSINQSFEKFTITMEQPTIYIQDSGEDTNDKIEQTNGLLEGVWGAISGIGNLVNDIIATLANLPQKIAEGLKSFFDAIIDGLNELGKYLVDNIVNLGNFIGDCLTNLGNSIANALQGVQDFLGNLLQGIIDGLISLGTFIIDGLKSLFIPSNDFFSDYFQSLSDFFTKKLGILIYPFTFIANFIGHFMNIGSGSGIIHINSVDINGWHIIDGQDFNLKSTMHTGLGDYLQIYYAFVDFILILGLINYARKMFDELVANHGGTK